MCCLDCLICTRQTRLQGGRFHVAKIINDLMTGMLGLGHEAQVLGLATSGLGLALPPAALYLMVLLISLFDDNSVHTA